MGASGTAVAVEAADVALAGNDISRLVDLVGLGSSAVRTIRANYGLSIGVHAPCRHGAATACRRNRRARMPCRGAASQAATKAAVNTNTMVPPTGRS
jgi:cation transport ATPase